MVKNISFFAAIRIIPNQLNLRPSR
jgi:hypothetical protein